MADLFTAMMRSGGVHNEVVVTGDGAEALDYLFGEGEYAERDTSAMPRLVVLDINMPRMDGFEALRRIRADERTELLPVAMLTSSNHEGDRTEAYRLGANSFLDKVSDTLPLSEMVPLVARYWLYANEPPAQLTNAGFPTSG